MPGGELVAKPIRCAAETKIVRIAAWAIEHQKNLHAKPLRLPGREIAPRRTGVKATPWARCARP